MNGLSTPSIIAIVACFIVTAGIALPLMIKAYLDWRAQAALWRALGTKYGVVTYLPPAGPVDLSRLTAAVEFAIDAIVEFGPWDRIRVLSAVGLLRIELNAVDVWTTLDGQHVAGQSVPESGLIRVGPKLAALCHEICHVLEWALDRKVDLKHESWNARGLYRATGSYEAWAGK